MSDQMREQELPGIGRRYSIQAEAGEVSVVIHHAGRVLAVATAVFAAFLVGLSAGPATIARLTFENPTVYALDIEVSPGTGTGWTSAGSVAQESTAEVHEVVDQGDVWLFRFDSQGASGGDLRLTRAELEASGWRIAVPAEVGQRLADAGAPPTP